MVDWTKPIEAVHTDGRVVSATVTDMSDSWVQIHPPVRLRDGQAAFSFKPNGSHSHQSEWTIRNAAPAWRTCDEQLDRMEALVQRLASVCDLGDIYKQARAILAAREPVDPRFAAIQNAIVNSLTGDTLPTATIMRMTRDVLAALDK